MISDEEVFLYIGESRPKRWKPVAWLIMLVEGTDHSHSFICWKDKRVQVTKYAEAIDSGGRITSEKRFLKKNHIVRAYEYSVSTEKMLELERWLWQSLGPYSKKHILGLLWMRIVSALGFKKEAKNPFKDGEYSQVCIELTARALQKIEGVDLPGEIEDYGLLQMQDFNKIFGKTVTSAVLDSMNSVY